MSTNVTFKQVLSKIKESYLRKIIHDSYLSKEIVTVQTLLQTVNEDPTLPVLNETLLRKVLKRYKISVLAKGVLVDRTYVEKRRIAYIRVIEKARDEKRPIYYLFETCLSLNRKVIWYTVRSEEFNLIDELLFDCPHKTNYHNVHYTETFIVWFTNMLAKLKPNAVVITNDSKYKKEDVPQKFWGNLKISNWLASKEIPFPDDLKGEAKKKALMKIVIRKKRHYEFYDLNKLAKTLFPDVDILTMPAFHEKLDLISFVAKDIFGYLRKQEGYMSLSLIDIKKMLDSYEMPCNVWREQINNVLEEEKRLYRLDDAIDEVVDNYLGYPVIRLQRNKRSAIQKEFNKSCFESDLNKSCM